MPRKPAAKPGPKSRKHKPGAEGESSKNVRSFLGDGSTAEESPGENESFLSADLDGQTDYDLDYTTSRLGGGRKSSRQTRPPPSGRKQDEQPTVSSTGRKSGTVNPNTPTKRRRKQRNPEQRDKRFWREVKNLQSRADNLIPRASFARLIREILIQESSYANRVTYTALAAFQEAAEMYLTSLFQDAYCCTLHRGRITLNVKDIELTRFLRGRSDPGNR